MSAVTKYGSQRLVNNGKLRRRGIIVVDDDDDDGDEIAFYERFKDARLIAAHDTMELLTQFQRISTVTLSDSSFIRVDLSHRPSFCQDGRR